MTVNILKILELGTTQEEQMTVTNLANVLALVKKLEQDALKIDSDDRRSRFFEYNIRAALAAYRELHFEKSKNVKQSVFLDDHQICCKMYYFYVL